MDVWTHEKQRIEAEADCLHGVDRTPIFPARHDLRAISQSVSQAVSQCAGCRAAPEDVETDFTININVGVVYLRAHARMRNGAAAETPHLPPGATLFLHMILGTLWGYSSPIYRAAEGRG